MYTMFESLSTKLVVADDGQGEVVNFKRNLNIVKN